MDLGKVVRTAEALSDGTRVRILAMLVEGPKAVSELAEGLGVVQPGVSAHLATLRRAGLVSWEAHGRQRVYRISMDRAEDLLGALATLAGEGGMDLGELVTRESLRESPFRRARTCYGHLAGIAGVELLGEMLARGWLEEVGGEGRISYRPTPEGERALEERGVDVGAARRARRLLAFGCPDWSEGGMHLGGALGAEVFRTLRDGGFLSAREAHRPVTVLEPVDRWLR